ncbi:MAG: hypothetical protein AABP62_24930 [Planctomycetota bacterium]
MNFIPYSRRWAQILPTIVLFCAGPVFHLSAEGAPQAETHTLVGIIWNSRVPPTYATDYLSSVAQRHKINHPMLSEDYVKHIKAIKKNLSQAEGKIQEARSRGYVYYLRNQFPPSFVTVGFCTVADQAEFKALVYQEKSIQPTKFATVEGAGDRFTLNVMVDKAMMPTYFRLHNGVMFHAQDNGLYSMDLPGAEALAMPADDQSRDMVARFEFDRIPVVLRDLPLVMARVSAQQRRPDEDETLFEFRKAALEYGLSIAKTVLDGTRKAEFALTLLHKNQPGDLQLDLDVKKDSSLAEAMGRMASFDRHLAIAADSALCTLALQTGPSDELLGAVFSGGANLLRSSLEGSDSAAQIAALLETLANHRSQIDGFVSLGIDRAGELVLYGAIAASDSALDTAPVSASGVFSVDIPRNWFNQFEILASADEVLPSKLSLRLDGSTVWFSLGRSQSEEKLDDAIAAQKGEKAPSNTAFLTAGLQAERWVSDHGAKREALARLERAIAGNSTNSDFRSFLDETLTENGFARLSVELDESASKHVRLKASVGDGLARFIAARYLQTEHIQLEKSIEDEKIAYKDKRWSPPEKRMSSMVFLVGNLVVIFSILVFVWWRNVKH